MEIRPHLMTTLFSILLICTGIVAQETSSSLPLLIELNEKSEASVIGNLADGLTMTDLSWAWQSSVACFPETQKLKFTGHHQLFEFEIPSRTEVVITLTPLNKKHNMSLYAYMIGVGNDAIVPNLSSCIRCEADYKWDRAWVGKTQDHRRIVKDILAIQRPYKVIVGVAGAEGLSEGEFVLDIKKK